jgi:hypothetical protein
LGENEAAGIPPDPRTAELAAQVAVLLRGYADKARVRLLAPGDDLYPSRLDYHTKARKIETLARKIRRLQQQINRIESGNAAELCHGGGRRGV